jgi:hypothetical protein
VVKLMRRLFAFLSLLTIASCGIGDEARAQASPYKEVCADRPSIVTDTLYFCGTLDDGFVKFLSTNASPQVRKLIITSYGGRFDSAKAALEIVERNGIEIVVEGICASACAQFLFIPASKGEVLPGAILALHTTSTTMRAMRLREGWKEYDRLRPLMDSAAQDEEALYRQYGLDPRLLVEPTLAMRPACISEKVDWANPQWPKMDYFAQNLWWVPRKAELEQFGMQAKKGFWVETMSDMQLLGSANKKYRIGNFVVGGNPSSRMKVEKLGEISKCEALKKP